MKSPHEPRPSDGVIRDAFSLYRRYFVQLVPFSLAIFTVVAFLSGMVAGGLGLTGALVSMALSLAGLALVQAVVAAAPQDAGQPFSPPSFSAAAAALRPRLGAVLAAAALMGAGLALGFSVLLVPGFLLAAWWCAVMPLVVEGPRHVLDAFAESQRLTGRHFLDVVGVVGVAFLVAFAANVVLGVVLTPVEEPLRSIAILLLADGATAPFLALVWTLLYRRLVASGANHDGR
jgi:hypothetical protein